jgi:nucleoside-diphosphate-sugar epimerase
VRPAGIFGARDNNTVPYFRVFFNLPLTLIPKFSFPFVYAGDVANCVAGALGNDASAGKAYLTAGRNATLYDLAKAWREASGKRNWIVPIPTGLGMYVDCSRAEQEIGFTQRPFVETLRETLEADARYRAAGVAS